VVQEAWGGSIEATEAEEDAREDLAERKLTWYGAPYVYIHTQTYMYIIIRIRSYMYIYA
jgi:hypothetical protein